MELEIKNIISNHYKNNRIDREDFIKEHLGGDGRVVDSFVISRGHPHGDELHEIRDNGLIVIFNKKSGKLITKIIARERQIRRYYESTGREPPPEYEDILRLARKHKALGYHEK